MTHALTIGRRGMGRTWPNPAVGCVIVSDGRVVGRGFTQPGGRPHAETQALAQAGAAAPGATAYVTLEPCSHHGQTPPCAEALIAAQVARVVAPFEDSDPRVSGRGFAMLRAAGITVSTGVCIDQAARDHAGFFARVTLGRPLVTLKLATTLDGRIATANGDSQWITGPVARRAVHAARACHDAVMVGAGTARADDPSLTVRGLGVTHQPIRIVVSRLLDVPQDGALARTARDVPVLLCHGPDVDAGRAAAWDALGARRVEVPLVGRQLDMTALLQALGAIGLTRVFCEGGGQLAASLLAADLVDQLQLHSGGAVIGAEGRPAIGAMGLDRLADAPRFELETVTQAGADVIQYWRRQASA